MSTIGTIKTLFEIAKLGVDISTDISAERRAARADKEKRERERAEAANVARIRELEAENARLRAEREK